MTHFKNHFTQNNDTAQINDILHKTMILALKIQLTDPQKTGDLTKISR